MVISGILTLGLCGCPPPPSPGGGTNTTDPTNGGAGYLGAATCQACHPSTGALHARHGHSQILKHTEGVRPTYPPGNPWAGVPELPPGLSWQDIDFVVGGYRKIANFVDRDGYLVIDAATGRPGQYNLHVPVAGTVAGFVPLAQPARSEYSYACFRCHTTDPQPVELTGMREGNLPGVGGTWAEPGVQCEACHGPGSRHVPDPSAGNIYTDPNSSSCIRCHSLENGLPSPNRLRAADGFIVGYQQVEEVAASPHAGFNCATCHDPHASVVADRETAVRNRCQNCHANMDMALHEGRTYTQGDHVESLRCESCHMPLASKYALSAPPEFTAGVGRIGDVRTHIMSINTLEQSFNAMFSPDGTQVALDANGKAAVTLDYVCLRCHHGQGSAFELDLDAVSEIAPNIHDAR